MGGGIAMTNENAVKELSACLNQPAIVQGKFRAIFQNPCPAIQPQVGSDNYLRTMNKLDYAYTLMRGVYTILRHEVSKNAAQG